MLVATNKITLDCKAEDHNLNIMKTEASHTKVGTLIVATMLERRHATEPNNVAYTTR
jgi:hypothetical protein